MSISICLSHCAYNESILTKTIGNILSTKTQIAANQNINLVPEPVSQNPVAKNPKLALIEYSNEEGSDNSKLGVLKKER